MEKLSLDYLPPGVRFSPKDKEVIELYLKKKITGNDKDTWFIPEIEFYKDEPWDLPSNLLVFLLSHTHLHFLENLMLFCEKVRKCFTLNQLVDCSCFVGKCVALIDHKKQLQRSCVHYLFSGIGVVWFMLFLVSVFFSIKTHAFLGYAPLLQYGCFSSLKHLLTMCVCFFVASWSFLVMYLLDYIRFAQYAPIIISQLSNYTMYMVM